MSMKFTSEIIQKILLESVEGSSASQLAQKYNCHYKTIARWRKNYLTVEQKEIIAGRKFYDNSGNQLSNNGSAPCNQIAILDALRANGPMRFEQIRKFVGIRSIGTSVNKLIKKGFVSTRWHRNHKYYIVISLSTLVKND